jgi:iron complex transport system substrate-binding protein
MCSFLARLSLSALVLSAGAMAGPARVVSMNLCADELVLALADRDQIQSVSWLVHDPSMSWSADDAAGIPRNHGLAEEIIPLRPDLVVTGAFSNPATNAALERIGIALFELELATDLKSIEAEVLRLAEALGRRSAGRSLVADMRARIARLGSGERYGGLSAVVYEPNGYVAGVGSLADEVIRAAGLRNLAVELDLVSYGQFPLELLLTNRPDLLIMNRVGDSLPSLAHAVLDHPALDRAFAAEEVVSIPPQAWSCGSPAVIAAIEALRAAADRLLRAES